MTIHNPFYAADIDNIPKFVGDVYYVSNTTGSDTNDGKAPSRAFATITKAITETPYGGYVRVMAGEYEEAVDVNVEGLELHLETGAIIHHPTDTPLTISADYCWVGCQDGIVTIRNTNAAVPGVTVSGSNCYFWNLRVNNGSVGTIGFNITGADCDLRECRVYSPTTCSYEIQNDATRIFRCLAQDDDDSVIGYHITNSADKVILLQCFSQGNATAAFQIDAGCTHAVVAGFASGGGDGRWINNGTNTVISNLTYPNLQHKEITLTTGGGTAYNLFKIVGGVSVHSIVGHVTTDIENVASTAYLRLNSAGGAVDITDSPGTNIQDAVAGAVLARVGVATTKIALANPSGAPAVIEGSVKDPKSPIICTEDPGGDTYIQLALSAALNAGVIHWHINWEPVTDDGYLEPA